MVHLSDNVFATAQNRLVFSITRFNQASGFAALYLSSPTRWEHNFGVYPYVFMGGLFNETIADKIY